LSQDIALTVFKENFNFLDLQREDKQTFWLKDLRARDTIEVLFLIFRTISSYVRNLITIHIVFNV
jgi:hypothetical protein